MSYAKGTSVPVDRSKTEIEKTLQRYGATGFFYAWDEFGTAVGFRIDRWNIRLTLPMADRADFERTPTGIVRAESAIEDHYNKETRRRWRALLLVIKAKLEGIESGITTFENEFLAYIVAHDGQTVGDHILPKLEAAIASGDMPLSLIPGKRGSNE